ncbi:hypothetical protein BV25DRAFT_1879062 [Artomyces pyxidatus]|uniref:Uncharacterized protein n=1 Tax=Artomyces pyxidatus TaxID=48021 RepID=A0ACB8TAW8_9AGAM|nr:hypothetical protein BV25DRAFT_1879062 [Artomyces pyxidatus]
MQSAPKIIIQILITGTQIFGKALLEAGRQAVKSSDVAGVKNATTGSLTDKLTREHRMTMDEAHLILNVKRGEQIERILQNYEHLFKANSPPAAPPKPVPGARHAPPTNSHYLQSKVVRARERIEAEMKIAAEEPPQAPPAGDAGPTAGKS